MSTKLASLLALATGFVGAVSASVFVTTDTDNGRLILHELSQCRAHAKESELLKYRLVATSFYAIFRR